MTIQITDGMTCPLAHQSDKQVRSSGKRERTGNKWWWSVHHVRGKGRPIHRAMYRILVENVLLDTKHCTWYHEQPFEPDFVATNAYKKPETLDSCCLPPPSLHKNKRTPFWNRGVPWLQVNLQKYSFCLWINHSRKGDQLLLYIHLTSEWL